MKVDGGGKDSKLTLILTLIFLTLMLAVLPFFVTHEDLASSSSREAKPSQMH